ncbi:MAG: hypothetical protein ACYC2H_13470 [Thermoplasmatota archaeon]
MVSRTMTRTRRGGRTASTNRRGRSANLRRGRTSNLRRGRTSRSRTTRGRSTRSPTMRSRIGSTRKTARKTARRMPQRGANGRFVRRRVRTASRSRRPARTPRTRRVSRPRIGSSIVREASERSKAGPALVKRRWYKIDGPVDPSLPEGFAYER